MQKVKLTDICTAKQWKTISLSELETAGYPVYGANGKIGFYKEFNHSSPTLLLGCRGTCGKVHISEPFSYVTGNAMCLDDLSDTIDIKYLYHQLTAYDFSKIISGTSQPQITREGLSKVWLSFPAIEEQKRIAATLDAVSDLIRLRKRQLEELDLLVKARFVEMFGGGLVSYKKSRLDSLCSFFNDGNWIESKDQSFEGYRLIQTGNIGNGEYLDKDSRARFISEETFSRLNCTEVFEGDILISRLPDPIGRACTIPSFVGKAITAVDCTIVRLKDICRPEYFIEFSKAGEYAEQLNSFTTGSTRKRVSRSNLGSIIVPVPPIDLQNHFASFIKEFDKMRNDVQNGLNMMELLKRVLIQRYFSI